MRWIIATLSVLLCSVSMWGQDSTQVVSGIDSIVVFSAKDSAQFKREKKQLRLRGSSDVKYRTQELSAEIIVLDFTARTMKAEGATDSTGSLRGFPLFRDNGEEFAGREMEYSFESRRGRVVYGETNVEGGFYYGSSIKRVGETTAYVEDGCFTTCDAPHPHFYFKASKMKVLLNDKIFLDPAVWYVEDVPIFALPFGIFVSMERGRRSGLILPTPLMTSDRGVVLQNLGYYFALSDYVDTEIAADITTKGGVTLSSRTQYALRDRFSGRAQFTLGYSRFNVRDPYATNIGVTLAHQQQFRPNESAVVDLFFTSQGFFQNTSLNPIDRVRQNARSNASYQRTLYNGMTFNVGYTRDQNMITGSVTQNPFATFAIPQLQPLRGIISGDHWLRDLQFSYRSSARYFHSATRAIDTGAYAIDERSAIEHRPSITVTPRLGNILLAPSITYSENWYFQRYTESVNPLDSSIVRTRETGMFREYTYGVGVSASTFLYGLAHPRILGWQSIRHTFQPSVGLAYVPDQSDPSLGFIGEYVSPITGQRVQYGRFGSAGALASRQQQFLVTGSFLNRVAIKVRDSDTSERPIELFTLNFSTSYNLASDSLQLAPISFNLRTPVLDALEFNVNGSFSAYDQALIVDPATGRARWTDISTSMLANGKGLARLTSLSVQAGTRFTSQGVSFAPRSQPQQDTTQSPESNLASRFERRVNYRQDEVDLFGERTPGWSPLTVPWEFSLQAVYSYTRPNPDLSVQSLFLSFRGSVSLTQTLDVYAVGTIDVLGGEITSPIF